MRPAFRLRHQELLPATALAAATVTTTTIAAAAHSAAPFASAGGSAAERPAARRASQFAICQRHSIGSRCGGGASTVADRRKRGNHDQHGGGCDGGCHDPCNDSRRCRRCRRCRRRGGSGCSGHRRGRRLVRGSKRRQRRWHFPAHPRRPALCSLAVSPSIPPPFSVGSPNLWGGLMASLDGFRPPLTAKGRRRRRRRRRRWRKQVTWTKPLSSPTFVI